MTCCQPLSGDVEVIDLTTDQADGTADAVPFRISRERTASYDTDDSQPLSARKRRKRSLSDSRGLRCDSPARTEDDGRGKSTIRNARKPEVSIQSNKAKAASSPSRRQPFKRPTAATKEYPIPAIILDRRKARTSNAVARPRPARFSLKPPCWQEWTAPEYASLASAVSSAFDARLFASKHHKQVDEVLAMLGALVYQPLQDAAEAKRRGKAGMKKLFALFNEYGTPVRGWAAGGPHELRGELSGIKVEGVAVMKAEGATSVVPFEHLAKEDLKYLEGVLGEKDKALLMEKTTEIEKGA